MEPSFWLERWELGQTGFHQDLVHPDLDCFASRWPGAPGSRVLVPLCGKSWDLAHLAQAGHDVVGVELSEIAVRTLFKEQGIEAEEVQVGPHKALRAPGMEVRIGDIFHLDTNEVFDAIWDRAAIVALDPERREQYARKLTGLLRPGGQMLVNAMHYEQSKMSGPPHSVTPEMLQGYYGEHFEIELLCEKEMIQELPRFAERGLESLVITTSLLTRR